MVAKNNARVRLGASLGSSKMQYHLLAILGIHCVSTADRQSGLTWADVSGLLPTWRGKPCRVLIGRSVPTWVDASAYPLPTSSTQNIFCHSQPPDFHQN
jgi:hypothetical protein